MIYFLSSDDARVGDNVVFVREPGNPFNPKRVKFGLSRDSSVYIFLVIKRPENCIL